MLALSTAGALAADITVDADCSLANAIRAANGADMLVPLMDCEAGDSPVDADNTGLDTITIDITGTDEGAIRLDGTLSVTSEITIEGNGYTVNGGANQIFSVTAGHLSVNNLTLTSGFSLENGGAIHVDGASLRLFNSAVRDSGARGYGGGIYALNSDVELIDSVVSGNVTGPDARDSVLVEVDEQVDEQSADLLTDEAQAEGSAQSETESTDGATDEELPEVDGSSGGGVYFAGDDNTLIAAKSGFDNNSSPEDGGGIAIASGFAYFNDSTLSSNRAEGVGGGIHNAGNAVLKHVTLVYNWATSGSGISDAASLQLYNSIVSENTGGDCDGALNANLGNIIRDGSCNHDGATDDPDLLLLAGSPTYYLPQEGSPAIDAAIADFCTETDQRNINRIAEACDIGAAEHQAGVFEFQIQSALAALAPPDAGGSSRDTAALVELEPIATPMPSLCASLPAHISVTGYTYSSQCRHVDYRGVGNNMLVDNGAIHAVDVFGWVATPMSVCFQHHSGGIVILDAATAPRNLIPLRTATDGSWQCATIDRTGTVVLMPLGFFTSGAISEPIWDLTDCQVTTTDILNLRSQPESNSEILANVLNDVELTADQRATYFYRVNYYDVIGWLSKEYLTYQGGCQ